MFTPSQVAFYDSFESAHFLSISDSNPHVDLTVLLVLSSCVSAVPSFSLFSFLFYVLKEKRKVLKSMLCEIRM